MAAEASRPDPAASAPIFLKLGGSLLTDKTAVEAVRAAVLARLAAEIALARQALPGLRLLLGHGSGSFGHVAAARHGTRQGVSNPAQWRGLAEVSDAAARLNRLVVAALLAADVPALSLQPSASARCVNGRIQHLAPEPVEAALAAGLLPVVYGDQYLSNKRRSDLSGKIVGLNTNKNARRSLLWDTEYEKLMPKAISARNYE
jgi:isopentenyl phosphate kinase